MKDDDGTVAGIFLHVVENLFAAQFFTVIAGNHVPHDDFVFLSQFVSLAETHVSVRRAEQRTMYQFVGGIDIAHVILDGIFHTLNVIHGVVAGVVSAFENLGIEFGIAGHIFAYAEEGGLHIVVVEQVEYPGGDFGHRSVVEGEIYGLFLARQSPYRFGKEHAVEKRGTFYKHDALQCV